MTYVASVPFGTAAVALLLLSSAAIAGDMKPGQADARRGLELARKSCANCHFVPGVEQSKIVEGIPSFRVIANQPDQTAHRLRNILIKPHQPMPQLSLSRSEIADLIALLHTLRQPEAGKPLLPQPEQGRKATYPSPS